MPQPLGHAFRFSRAVFRQTTGDPGPTRNGDKGYMALGGPEALGVGSDSGVSCRAERQENQNQAVRGMSS
jgi:hypothetical protein